MVCADANALAVQLGEFVQEDFRYTSSRRESFDVTRKWKWRIHDWLKTTFEQHPGFEKLFGLGQPVNKFYVRALRRVDPKI